MRNLAIAVLLLAGLAATTAWWLLRPAATNDQLRFSRIGVVTVDGNAEIVQVTPDGNTLVHTNAERSSVDLISIAQPGAPSMLASISLPGEPTSVALSPDGNWALASVYLAPARRGAAPANPFFPGGLAVISIANPAAPRLIEILGIGHHPDSLAVTKSGPNLYAILAIENEPVVVEDGKVTGADDPGKPNDISRPGAIQIVSFDPDRPDAYRVATLDLSPTRLERAGLLFPADPQPEFIAIAPDQTIAAASLQENNGIVVFDPYNLEIKRVFSLGSVAERAADLRNDDTVALTQNYPGAARSDQPLAGMRFPDGIAFSPDGNYLLSADEGEAPLTGGRGFSIWTLDGEFVWDDGGSLERAAAAAGLYDDARSGQKGIEVEGVTTARFGTQNYAFLAAERGNFVAVCDISTPAQPVFVQLLKTGKGPEGIVTIGARGLVVAAAEAAGELHIYSHNPRAP